MKFNQEHLKRVLVAGASTFALCAHGAALQAQESDDMLVFEEITVTAQKRTESVQDVPVAISAFDANFTKRANLDDVKDMVKFTPGFAGDSKDSFVDYINVRGISTNDFGVGGDPSVGFFKNGFYQGRNGSAVTSMFDMERVEVLRGPQGFLFGRSAIAGAISTHTAKPKLDETSAHVDGGIGERGIMEGEIAVNMPMSDNSALRLAGYGSHEDGYVTNNADPNGKKLVEHKKYAFRASGLITGDNWDATLIGEYEDRKQSGSVYRPIIGDETLQYMNSVLFPNVDLRPGGDARSVNVDNGLGDSDNGELLSLTATINYEFDFATLTSATGFKDHSYLYAEDFDGLPIAVNNYRQDQEGKYFEQELRLVSNTDGDLSWYAGLSYYSEELDVNYDQQSNEDAQCGFYYAYYYGTRTCAELWDYWEYPAFTPSANGLLESNTVNAHYKGYGAYVDLNYAVTEKLDLGFGVRYSKDKKNFTQNVRGVDSELGSWFALGFRTAGVLNDEKSWSDLTPRFVAKYRTDNDWLVYGSASRGFKSGGFGTFGAIDSMGNALSAGAVGSQANGDRPANFDPETVWSYEFGVKGDFADRRILVDANLYHYNYKDMQLTIFDPTAKVVNVGTVSSTGFESTVQAILTEKLDVFLAGSYNHNSVKGTEGIEPGSTGNRLPGMPKLSLSGLINYRQPVGDGEVVASADFRWQSKIYGGLKNDPFAQVDDWSDVSIRIGYEEANWSVTGYVENVFDAVYFDGSLEPAGEILPAHYFGVSRPRTFGVRFSYDFGE